MLSRKQIATFIIPLIVAIIEAFNSSWQIFGTGILSVYVLLSALSVYVLYEIHEAVNSVKTKYTNIIKNLREINNKADTSLYQTDLLSKISNAYLYVSQVDDEQFRLNAEEEFSKIKNNLESISRGEIYFKIEEKSGVWRSMDAASTSIKTVFFAEKKSHFELWHKPNMTRYLEKHAEWLEKTGESIERLFFFDPNLYQYEISLIEDTFDLIESNHVLLKIIPVNVLLNNNSPVDFCDRVFVDDRHVFIHDRKVDYGNGYRGVTMVENQIKLERELTKFQRWSGRSEVWNTEDGRVAVTDWINGGLEP